jgi:hypothetical protein
MSHKTQSDHLGELADLDDLSEHEITALELQEHSSIKPVGGDQTEEVPLNEVDVDSTLALFAEEISQLDPKLEEVNEVDLDEERKRELGQLLATGVERVSQKRARMDEDADSSAEDDWRAKSL